MEQNTVELKNRAYELLQNINRIEIEQSGALKTRQILENNILELSKQIKNDKEALDIATHAIEILRQVSDEAVSKAYGFLENSLNSTLERMFKNTTRKIRIKEFTRGGQYPQLEIELDVGNGRKRSLKSDSGHGIAQIVSLLSILSLIVITGSRRLMIMDEVISGLSVRNRKIINDIIWTFTEIGFQFIINEHGFIPEGSHVYHLEMNGDVSGVKQDYIATKGVYLQGGSDAQYDYSKLANENVSTMGKKEKIEEDFEEQAEEMIDNEEEALEKVEENNVEEDNVEEDNSIISI